MKKSTKSISVIFLVLIFAGSISMMLPTAHAQQTTTQKTYPLIDAIPNPVGVGEQVLIRFGISEGLGVVSQGWTGITVTVVDPNNQVTALGPFKTDSTGSSFAIFVPSKVGTYKLTTNFPQQTVEQPGWYVAERGAFLAGGTVILASNISNQPSCTARPPAVISRLTTPNRILDTPNRSTVERMVFNFRQLGRKTAKFVFAIQ